MKRDKGFTLVELMIVVAVIGILAAIAIPNFLRFQARAKQAEAKINLAAIWTSATAYQVANFTYVIADIGDLGFKFSGQPRYSYWYAVGEAQAPGFNPPGGGNNPNGGPQGNQGCPPGRPFLCGAPQADGAISGGSTATVPCNVTVSPAGVAASATSFTIAARGNIDADSMCDDWLMNEQKQLVNSVNDTIQ